MKSNKKIALVTGGAKRIGQAICKLLHESDIDLMIHYRHSADEAKKLQENLNKIRKNSANIIQADLVDTSVLPNLVEETIKKYGRLDILINNASSYYPTEIGKMNERNWNDLIGSNLKAPLFLSQLAADELIKTKGCIINITDTHIDTPKKNFMIYSVAKSGLTTLTKSLAQELSPDVRVNAVAPGPVLWPENNEEFNDIYKQRVISQTLLKKMGTPEDVAMAVKFLVLDAPFITGHILAVDGGRSLSL
jgi:pteridine reductase